MPCQIKKKRNRKMKFTIVAELLYNRKIVFMDLISI